MKDNKSQSRSQSGIRDCKYCGSNHQCRELPLAKYVRHVVKRTILPRNDIASKQAQSSGGTKHKSFIYREVNLHQESSDDGQIDEITSKVKSMYYHVYISIVLK